ncbi:MAG: PilZ domain-containing protein [Proteobacteria bacterium]|nr:PilZ domain-containing protein [Pseudomonadota bacterium]MBU4448317.1 PilZ domain-containing protein [Pseudomonadota bacterium]MCG2772991.1 PilZ domain-containing protein [Desulfobacterales bacterium]
MVLVLDLSKILHLTIIHMRGLDHSSTGEKMPPKVNRKCVRYQVDWEVKTFNGQPVAETSLFDLSATGAKIEGTKPLAPRNHVEFTYVRPGDDRERSHTGIIMWMRPLIHKPGRYQMGVKFYEFDWSLDQELRQVAKF